MRIPSSFECYLLKRLSKEGENVSAELGYEYESYYWMRKFTDQLRWVVDYTAFSQEFDTRCLNMRNNRHTRIRCLPENLKEAVMLMCDTVSDTFEEMHKNERVYFSSQRVLSRKGRALLTEKLFMLYNRCLRFELTPKQQKLADEFWHRTSDSQ